MQKWFVHISLGIMGCDGYDVIEAEDELEAEQIAWEYAMQHAQSYFEVLSFEEEDEAESESMSWGQDYIFESDVDFSMEKYVPEEHDEYLN